MIINNDDTKISKISERIFKNSESSYEIGPLKNVLLNNYYNAIASYYSIADYSLQCKIATHLIVYETCFIVELFLKCYLLDRGCTINDDMWSHDIEKLIENAKNFDYNNIFEFDEYRRILLKIIDGKIKLNQYANTRYNHFKKEEKLLFNDENKDCIIIYSEEVLKWIKKNLRIE